MNRDQWFAFAIVLFIGGIITVLFPYRPVTFDDVAAQLTVAIFGVVGLALIILSIACGICGYLEPKQKHK